MYQTKRTLAPWAAAAALMLLGAAGYAQTFDPDYTRRIPITIANNSATPTPTPTSVEALISLDDANMRVDRKDVRLGYWNGSSLQIIDSKIFRGVATVPPGPLTRNLNAGKTDFSALPEGTRLSISGQDDATVVVDLPFQFPFVDTASDKLVVGMDGYLGVGTADPGRSDDVAAARASRVIMPWTSDYDSSGSGQGVWYATDNNGPGGSKRAIVRWVLQASGGATTIARFAVILTENGDIRFVYGNPVNQPNVSWSVLKMGVGYGSASLSMIDTPTENFTNHDDVLFTQQPGSTTEKLRVVFRLQSPIAANSSSTNQYFLLYGNPSPDRADYGNVRNVFDHVVDFQSGTIGQPAADWDVLRGNTVTVENYTGTDASGNAMPPVKVGVLRRGEANHPHAIVKASAMPAFLNAELLARVAPKGGGQLEMAPMLRAVSNPGDPNFQAGYGYAVDGFGTPGGSHIVSYVGVMNTAEPATMAGVSDPLVADQWENILFRINGTPGTLSGKNWTEGSTEPANWMLTVNRAEADPQHGGVSDPPWNSPGTTGMGGYSQDIAMDYIALRELRDVAASPGTVQVAQPAGPFIQGVVSSSNPSLNPLTNTTLRITGPGGYDKTFYVGANGQYRVSLPADGAYTVEASAPFHTTTQATGVSPSASGQTNITLPYVGARISGVLRDGLTLARQANAEVTITDAQGLFVATTKSDARGEYTVMVATGGTYHVNWYSPTGVGTTVGIPRQVTVASGGEATFNSAGQFVGNGDAEMPNAANTWPMGWTNNDWGAVPPGGPEYIHAVGDKAHLNHTPGGHWSLAVKDPHGVYAWMPPPSGFFDFPVGTDVMATTVSFWVYFTAAGQEARMRLRNNLVPGSINVFAGQAPPAENDNKGGLVDGKVPVNQWYEIRRSFPAGTVTDPIGAIEMQIYVNGPENSNVGTLYFDDLTITRTPVAQVTGKVVDPSGNPIPNAYVGTLVAFSEFEEPSLISRPYTTTDDNGNFVMFTKQPGSMPISAWQPTAPISGYNLPDYGWLAPRVDAAASANPTPITITLSRATNVADGATATAFDTNGTRNITGNLSAALDNNLGTRWYQFGLPDGQNVTESQIITVDLGSAQRVDNLELWWEFAWADQFRVSVGPSVSALTNIYETPGDVLGGNLGFRLDLTPYSDGPQQVFLVPADVRDNVRYIVIEPLMFNGGIKNYSLIEIRALSTTAPLPMTLTDAADIVRIWGGLKSATPADVARLNKTGSADLTLEDAVAVARSLAQ